MFIAFAMFSYIFLIVSNDDISRVFPDISRRVPGNFPNSSPNFPGDVAELCRAFPQTNHRTFPNVSFSLFYQIFHSDFVFIFISYKRRYIFYELYCSTTGMNLNSKAKGCSRVCARFGIKNIKSNVCTNVRN